MGVTIITSFITLLGVVFGGIYFLRSSFIKYSELKAELALAQERRVCLDFKEKTSMYIALLALEFSILEGKEVTSRHFTKARDFYMDHSNLLGVEPKHFDGLFKEAKRQYRQIQGDSE